MIACPGCAGRNERGAFTCAFCNSRIGGASPGPAGLVPDPPGGALAVRATLLRGLLFAGLVLALLLLGALWFVHRAST